MNTVLRLRLAGEGGGSHQRVMPGSVGMKLRNGVVFFVRENKSVRLARPWGEG